MAWYAALAAAGASALGGILNYQQSNKWQTKSYNTYLDSTYNAIYNRVQDAKRSGIHPLYALGANVQGSAFQAMPSDALGNGLSNAANILSTYADQEDQRELLRAQIESVRLQNKQRELEIEAYNKPISTPAPAAPKMGDFVTPKSSSLVDTSNKGIGVGIQKEVQFMNAFRERSDGSIDFMPDQNAIDYISEFLPAGVDWTNEQFNPFNPRSWEQNQAIADALNVYNPKKGQVWVVDYAAPRGFYFRLHSINHPQDYRNIPILRRFDNKYYKFIDNLGYYINQNPEVLLLGGLGKAFRYFRRVGRRIKAKFKPAPDVYGIYGQF